MEARASSRAKAQVEQGNEAAARGDAIAKNQVNPPLATQPLQFYIVSKNSKPCIMQQLQSQEKVNLSLDGDTYQLPSQQHPAPAPPFVGWTLESPLHPAPLLLPPTSILLPHFTEHPGIAGTQQLHVALVTHVPWVGDPCITSAHCGLRW